MAWRTCECGNPINAYDAFTWKDEYIAVCEECSRRHGEPVYVVGSNEPVDYIEGPYGRLDPTRDPAEHEFSMSIFKPGGMEQIQRLENAKLRERAMPSTVMLSPGESVVRTTGFGRIVLNATLFAGGLAVTAHETLWASHQSATLLLTGALMMGIPSLTAASGDL